MPAERDTVLHEDDACGHSVRQRRGRTDPDSVGALAGGYDSSLAAAPRRLERLGGDVRVTHPSAQRCPSCPQRRILRHPPRRLSEGASALLLSNATSASNLTGSNGTLAACAAAGLELLCSAQQPGTSLLQACALSQLVILARQGSLALAQGQEELLGIV